MFNYILLVLMTIIGAIAAIFLKKSSSVENFKDFIFNINLYAGVFMYFVTALINIYVLRYLDYSVVLPFTALTYVWVMILSNYYISEIITKRKLIGLTSIFIGVIIISFN